MIKFGTGGWRAVIADEFTKANVQLLAAGLCDQMAAEGCADRGVCIGYDRRFMSREAAQWACGVFAARGVPCALIDRESPTPLIMYTVRERRLPYGLAVTASHNPAVYNGIKVFTEGGRDAARPVTDALEQHIAARDGTPTPALRFEDAVKSGAVRLIDPQNAYIDSILALVNVDAIKAAGLKVALDPMYGVSQTCLQTILLTARCQVGVIHERHDALFGGRLPAPNENTMHALSGYVTEHGCDLGIATDGDADRIGVIDEHGRFVHPNRLLVLLYYYLLVYRGWRGPAVRNICTTHLLDRVAEGFGQTCFEVPVGFKYISEKMDAESALIGGESSGGLTVRGHISGKDGIYAGALLAEMIAVSGKRLSALYDEITGRFGCPEYGDRDYPMTSEARLFLARRLFGDRALPALPFETARVSYADGCKVYFTNGGFAVCRFSGTEPLLRVCAETPTAEGTAACLSAFGGFIEKEQAAARL